MSFDFATAKICTHEVFFEQMTLSDDNQTAIFPFPPSSKRVDVYVNKNKVPSSGLYSFASITTKETSPFRIRSGVNDLLDIRIGFGQTRRIQLIPGTISVSDMVKFLKSKIPELDISAVGKKIQFKSRTRTNKTEFSFPDPRWVDTSISLTSTQRVLAAYQEMGIIAGRHVMGNLIYPGWTIEQDPFSPDGRGRQLVFKSPLRNNSPLVQTNYVTLSFECRRCRGTELEFDYTIANGTYETVKNTDLLAQEFDKFLFTDIGSHFKWNWLGSSLSSRIGGKGNTGQVTVNSLIAADVGQAFKVYQSIKSQQDSQFPQQKVSDSEFPQALTSLNVRTDPDDPTISIVEASVSSRSNEFIPLEREIGTPNPLKLIGDSSTTFSIRS